MNKICAILHFEAKDFYRQYTIYLPPREIPRKGEIFKVEDIEFKIDEVEIDPFPPSNKHANIDIFFKEFTFESLSKISF